VRPGVRCSTIWRQAPPWSIRTATHAEPSGTITYHPAGATVVIVSLLLPPRFARGLRPPTGGIYFRPQQPAPPPRAKCAERWARLSVGGVAYRRQRLPVLDHLVHVILNCPCDEDRSIPIS
jgi:hypothetical protein